MIETRLSSQTGHEQTPSHAVTNDEAFRVRLGPKHASVFGEQRPNTVPETSANVQAPYTHREKAGTPSDMRALYGDTLHEHPVQAGPHTRENTTPLPAGPTRHVSGPHAHQITVGGIDATPRQQDSGGEVIVPGNGSALPGLRPVTQGSDTARLRGSGWHGDHGDEEHSKSRKRSYTGKIKSQTHKSADKRANRSAGHGYHSEHHNATAPEGNAVTAQPRHPDRARQSLNPLHEDLTGADYRPVHGSTPGNGHQEFHSDDDDDVIFMGIQVRSNHTVMDLISDDDVPDAHVQQPGTPTYAQEVAAMPVMETVLDDGGPVCRSAAIPAPQLQTFTQAEDVAPQKEAQPSAAAKHGLQPPGGDDRHTTTRDRTSGRVAPAAGGGKGATAAPEDTQRGDYMHRSDEVARHEYRTSRQHTTGAVSERHSGHHDKHGKRSRSRSKHNPAHEASQHNTDATADRDRGHRKPHDRRVHDDERRSRSQKWSHHDEPRSPRRRERKHRGRRRSRSPEWSRSPKKGDSRRRRSPRGVRQDDEGRQCKHEHRTESAVGLKAAADDGSNVAAVQGDKVQGIGSSRQPLPAASPAAAEPSVEPGRIMRKGTKDSDQHTDPGRDLRAALHIKGGLRGHADGPHVKSTGPHTTHRGHKGGDVRVGQFLTRRNSAADAPKQSAIPRQSSGEGLSPKQARSAGAFLPRGKRASDLCQPSKSFGETGHFLTRHNSAPVNPDGATRNTVPYAHVNTVPAVPSMSARERSQAAPEQQPGSLANSMAVDCRPGLSGKHQIGPGLAPHASVQVRFQHHRLCLIYCNQRCWWSPSFALRWLVLSTVWRAVTVSAVLYW